MSDLRPRARRSRRASVVRHGRLKRSNPFAVIAKFLAAAVAVVLVSGASVAAIAAWDVTNSVKPGIHLVGEKTNGPVPNIGAMRGGINLLLVGTDTRTGQGDEELFGDPEDSSSGAGLNDVTILLHIAEDHKSATAVSFPRDLMIPIPKCPDGHGGYNSAMSKQQLNTTLFDGGLACTVLTIQQLTGGLKIPFAAMITFDGVIEMSNVVGGVTVCIADPIKDPYTQTYLPAGNVTLKGADALGFLRTRHGVGNGSDLSRISSQQVFLSALVRKIKSGGVLGNPLKLYPLAKAAVNNMHLSDSLNNPTTMVEIALALKNIPLSNVLFLQYPVYTDPDNPNRVVPNHDAADTLFEAIKNDRPLQISGGTGSGSVINPNAPTKTPTAPPLPPSTSTSPPSTGQATSGPVVLPEDVHGQSAEQQTCSKGND